MFAATVGLYAIHRLAVAGVLQSTFGLFLLGLLGAQVRIAGHTVGVATLTGLGLGLSTVISATSAPIIGGLSDRTGERWRVAAGGLLPGVVGFGLLSAGIPFATMMGVPLIAITGGSNQGLSTALIGDLGNVKRQSRQLGVLFTAGDLASAVGPPLAYALVPIVGAKNVYAIMAALFLCASVTILLVDRTIRRS
jgi:MFS family permease